MGRSWGRGRVLREQGEAAVQQRARVLWRRRLDGRAPSFHTLCRWLAGRSVPLVMDPPTSFSDFIIRGPLGAPCDAIRPPTRAQRRAIHRSRGHYAKAYWKARGVGALSPAQLRAVATLLQPRALSLDWAGLWPGRNGREPERQPRARTARSALDRALLAARTHEDWATVLLAPLPDHIRVLVGFGAALRIEFSERVCCRSGLEASKCWFPPLSLVCFDRDELPKRPAGRMLVVDAYLVGLPGEPAQHWRLGRLTTIRGAWRAIIAVGDLPHATAHLDCGAELWLRHSTRADREGRTITLQHEQSETIVRRRLG